MGFMGHDLEDEAVGFVHAAAAAGGEIADATVHVVVNDAFVLTYAVALHGHHG